MVLEELGMFTIGAGLLTYLGRVYIKTAFEKDFEKHRHDLEKEKIKFSRLDERRAEKLEELYQNLDDFYQEIKFLSSGFDSKGQKEELIESAHDEMRAFWGYYQQNKIYFSKDVCGIVDELYDELNDVLKKFGVNRVHDRDEPHGLDSAEKVRRWGKASELMKEDVPEIREKLEEEFRRVLGVIPEQSTATSDGEREGKIGRKTAERIFRVDSIAVLILGGVVFLFVYFGEELPRSWNALIEAAPLLALAGGLYAASVALSE